MCAICEDRVELDYDHVPKDAVVRLIAKEKETFVEAEYKNIFKRQWFQGTENQLTCVTHYRYWDGGQWSSDIIQFQINNPV